MSNYSETLDNIDSIAGEAFRVQLSAKKKHTVKQ